MKVLHWLNRHPWIVVIVLIYVIIATAKGRP